MWANIFRDGETEEEYFCYDFARKGGNPIHLSTHCSAVQVGLPINSFVFVVLRLRYFKACYAMSDSAMLVTTLKPHTRQCLWTVNFRFTRPSPWAPFRSLKTRTLRSLPERFRILFMGRDEFSCLVLQELFQAKGELLSTHLYRHCVKPHRSAFQMYGMTL